MSRGKFSTTEVFCNLRGELTQSNFFCKTLGLYGNICYTMCDIWWPVVYITMVINLCIQVLGSRLSTIPRWVVVRDTEWIPWHTRTTLKSTSNSPPEIDSLQLQNDFSYHSQGTFIFILTTRSTVIWSSDSPR